MELTFRTISGKSFKVEADAAASVGELKAKVEAAQPECPAAQLKLVLAPLLVVFAVTPWIVVGAMLADKGSMAVQWNGEFSNVLFPAILAIAVTGVVAAVATWLALRITDDVDDKPRAAGFRLAQKGLRLNDRSRPWNQ